MSHAYWNQNTGQIARFDAPDLRLELLDNWHPIDPAIRDEDAPKPPTGGVFRPVELPHIPPPPAPEPAGDGPSAPVTGPAGTASTEQPPAAEKPNKSASKADWVAYAVAQGIDPADADALTRDQLVERFTDKEPS